MGVILLPDIGQLDPESLCYNLYTQLYQNFFNAQDAGTVTEGDQTSVRLHNTAYQFADAIAGAVGGGGSAGGGALAEYLKRSGGDMSGALGADYGFGAGIANRRVLEVYRTPVNDTQGEITSYDYGVRVIGDLKVEGNNLHFGDQQFITYIGKQGTIFIRYPKMDFSTSSIRSRGELYFGEDKTSGVYISASALRVSGHDVFHAGNAGNTASDWAMRDGTVAGILTVAGGVMLDGTLTTLHGVSLGDSGNIMLDISGGKVNVNADLSIQGPHNLNFLELPVLSPLGNNSMALNAPGGDLIFGYETTASIRFWADLKDRLGTHTLLTSSGKAYFPDSLRAAHNLGPDLLSTYFASDEDTGMVVHKFLRLGNIDGPGLIGAEGERVLLSSAVKRIVDGRDLFTWHNASFGHEISGSPLAPADRTWDDMFIGTDARHIHLGNPVYAEQFLGIAKSVTRLEKECLFLTDNHRFQSVEGGVKHYGQALFMDGLSSELFSSGLAGSGWAILRNRTTGSVTATFDEIVVRRKMRVYEMEVQRTRATDGALWISDSCSGDSVEKL